MKRYVNASISTDLSQAQLEEYSEDFQRRFPGTANAEMLGHLAQVYGLNLLEVLEVLDWMCICGDAKEVRYAAEYKIFAFEG